MITLHEHDVSCSFGNPTCPLFGEQEEPKQRYSWRTDKNLGIKLILAALPLSIGGLYWWPLGIPAIFCLYFGFMLACFT